MNDARPPANPVRPPAGSDDPPVQGAQSVAGRLRSPARSDQPPVDFVRPEPGWARAAADFDARVFGPDAWPYAVWVEELAPGGAGTYIAVAEEGGIAAVPRIIALGGVRGGIEAEILTIGVAESHRGRGLGGRLLDELVRMAAVGGSQEVFLEVRSRDRVARGLYASRGFIAVGVRRRYYGDDDAVVMRLAL